MKYQPASRNASDSKSTAHTGVQTQSRNGKSFVAIKDFKVKEPSGNVNTYSNDTPEPATEPVQTLQRMKVKGADGFEDQLKSKEITKVNRLINIMNNAVKGLVDDNDTIYIEIINRGEMSPAWNHHKNTKNHPGKTGDIGVELNKWYIEKASFGELLSMFVHEVGVHTLSDRQMGLKDTNDAYPKGSNIRAENLSQENEHVHKKGNHIIKAYTKDKKDRRQKDHVNLAKSFSGNISDRSKHYVNLYLRTGDAIAEEDKEDKKEVLIDLTRAFLFDIGRIIATDDGGAKEILTSTKAISELMNYYRDKLVEDYAEDHEWLRGVSRAINANSSSVFSWLANQFKLLTVSSHPVVQGVRGGVAGLGAAYLAGGSVAGIVSLPGLAAGAIVGLGVWGLQKLFGV